MCRLKILQVISSFPPAWAYGGPLRAAYGISKELVRRGHKVAVYTTDVCDARSRLRCAENPTYMDGIEVYHFRNVSNRLAYQNLPLAPAMLTGLKREIKNFDVVHIHEYISAQALLTRHFSRRYGIPYVLQPRGSLPVIIEKQGLKKIYDRIWGHSLLRDASKIIALNQMEAEQFQSRGVSGAKIEIVPNGIDPSEFEDLPRRGEFRRKHNLNNGQKIILYVGRLHKIKGLGPLVRAFAKLLGDFYDVKLVIIGPDNGYLPTLKGLLEELKLKEKVLLIGALYGRDKLEAYVDAEVYVLPSFYETFPNTVLEALACSLPVIVTDRCGIADVVAKAGFVAECDEDQLREALLKVLSDGRLRRRLGGKARRLVAEEFRWDVIVGKLESIYQRLSR